MPITGEGSFALWLYSNGVLILEAWSGDLCPKDGMSMVGVAEVNNGVLC